VRTVLLVAAALLALLAASAGGSARAASAGEPLLLEFHADFIPQHFATRYRASVAWDGAQPKLRVRDVRFTWHFTAPKRDPNCDLFNAAKPARTIRRLASQVAATATWLHGDQHGCNHAVEGPDGHEGTIAVTVVYHGWRCVYRHTGTNTFSDGRLPCRKP
jgi:hypothetical protein